MAEELVLYTNPMSRGRIARWMLEEVGAPYRAEVLGFGKPMKGALGPINGMGKVPTLVHGETVVTEAAAICAYLADAFPQAGLAPASGSRDRGPYYRWLFFAAGPLEAAVTNKALGVEVGDEQRAFVGYGSYGTTLDTLEEAVSKSPHLVGGRFSAADLYVASHLMWGMQFGGIEKRPAFEAYVATLGARPAHRKATEIDDGLMAQMQAQKG